MNNVDLPDDSDSSDEDYVPAGSNEVLSEVDSDGDPEDPISDSEKVDVGKRRKKKSKPNKRKASDLEEENEKKEETQVQTTEEKKKHADLLWASFKKDTNFKSVKKPEEEQRKSKDVAVPKKIKVTEVIEFAGEQMCVEKEISPESAAAKKLLVPSSSAQKKSRGGLNSVLNLIGKKTKVTTLEKSKLDWDKFKKEENIQDDLERYNKGKNGYLDRQDFLQRADLRRFEIEKEVRTVERNKRMNNI